MASEVERLEAELAAAKKMEEFIAAKEKYRDGDKSPEAREAFNELKAEVQALRQESKKDRVAGAVVDEEGGVVVTPETVEGAKVTSVQGSVK